MAFDCSLITSLASRRFSWMTRRFVSTFRVSRQCHRCATRGSSAMRRSCSLCEISISSSARGACSGRLLKRSSNSGGNAPSAFLKLSDGREESSFCPGAFSDLSSEAMRSGKMRCCIQYDVPPTMIGIWLALCASSICSTIRLYERRSLRRD